MSHRRKMAAPKPQRLKIDKFAEIKINQAPPGDDDGLLDTVAVATWFGISTQRLEGWRSKGDEGPKYIKVTDRLVRYRKGHCLEYLRSRVVTPTAEVTP
jgi:hypothetical protein